MVAPPWGANGPPRRALWGEVWSQRAYVAKNPIREHTAREHVERPRRRGAHGAPFTQGRCEPPTPAPCKPTNRHQGKGVHVDRASKVEVRKIVYGTQTATTWA